MYVCMYVSIYLSIYVIEDCLCGCVGVESVYVCTEMRIGGYMCVCVYIEESLGRQVPVYRQNK